MKTCAGSPPRRRCAALALLLLLVVLTIGESSLQWLQGSHHQQRRQRQQQQQREEQLGQHQGKGRRWRDGEGVYSFALILLTAEATQLPAQEQAPAAASGAATAGEATAAAESGHVDGTSKNAEVHAEQQQREASAGEQEQGRQRGASAPQPQEAGQLSFSQGRGMSRDVPKSTVLPVALPPASHFESLNDAAAAPQAAARAASADATATVLPSPLPRAEPNAAAVKEETPTDSTAGPPAVGDVDPRPSAQQQQPQSTERDVASSSSAGGPAADDSWLDSASAVTSSAGEAGKAAPHGDLLWTLLWPAAVFPVWMLARVSWLLKVLAVVAAAVMQLAPLPTALRVRAHRSTGEVQGLPFLLLLFSAALWLAYGLLKLDLVLLLPNVTGVFLSCWYLHIFMQYCGRPSKDVSIDYSSSLDSTSPRWDDEALECMQQAARGRKQRTQIYCHAAGCLLVACGICVAAAAGLARPTHLVGLTAAVVNVLTYAAPLAALRRVLRTRSTACMPVEVSVGNWICSSLWLIYGWLSADAFILLPNLLGTIVGLLQVGLLMKFPPPSRRYLAFVDGNADDVSASSHLCASVPGVACTPCAESSYLLTAADATAVGGAVADHSDAFSAVGTAAAGATALLTPTAARVGGPVLAGSALHEDAQSISSSCATASPPYRSTLPTAGVAYRQQQAWHVPQDFDNVKRTGGGNNSSSTNYGSSTCDSLSSTSIRGSRMCSPSINYGSSMCGTSSTTYGSSGSSSSSSHGSSVAGRSDCSVGSGVTRAAENLLSNEGPARHVSDTAHDDGYSRAYQPCARKSSSVINSSNGKSSLCGFNAPSLPTHEMLLRDWQQHLKDDEARRGLSSSTACASVAAATEGGGRFPP